MTPVQQRKHWYGTQRWKRIRKRVLLGNPLCAICGIAPATQCDHIKHRDDNATFWNAENLRPACAECNNRLGARARHARQGGRIGTAKRGCSTAQGSTKTDTACAKADRAVELFNRFKGGRNAEPNDQ